MSFYHFNKNNHSAVTVKARAGQDDSEEGWLTKGEYSVVLATGPSIIDHVIDPVLYGYLSHHTAIDGKIYPDMA